MQKNRAKRTKVLKTKHEVLQTKLFLIMQPTVRRKIILFAHTTVDSEAEFCRGAVAQLVERPSEVPV